MFRQFITTVLVFCFSLSVAAEDGKTHAKEKGDEVLASHIPHFAVPADKLMTGGQPTDDAWKLLKAAGVTTVINLRSAEEMKNSREAELVEADGMRYVNIPIAGAADINAQNATRLHEVLENSQGTVFVHCASSNRVGALLALDEAQHHGKTKQEAIRYGKAAGMASLTTRVQQVLDDQ